MKLSDNYRIIFLGDILDRGQYAVEIMKFILGLMIENNTKDKLSVILNRGNHESEEMYTYGSTSFKSELTKKGLDDVIPVFRDFISRLSSAIILDCNGQKYWLSHGGFYINRTNKTGPFYKYNITKQNIIFYHSSDSQIPKQIRWNDFISNNKYIKNDRGEGILNLTPNEVYDFCHYNDINFIIRGHQDYPFNSFLLSTHSNHNEPLNEYDKRYVLGHISADTLPINPHIFINKNYKNDGSKRLNLKSGPMAAVYLDTLIQTYAFVSDKRKLFKIYPVITISTNTDRDRPLIHKGVWYYKI